MSSETTVKVGVRIRPLLQNERNQQISEPISVVNGEPQIAVGNDQYFTFDYVFGQDSDQASIYDDCVQNLVDATFEGFNATILAYGQTGSGKTYTMGSTSTVTLSESEYGIIPRVIRTMFESIENQENQDNNRTYRVRIQYLEIYGEELRDLLDQNSSTKVTIRETPAGGVYVSGTREELVTSAEETLMALEKGSVGRTTGSTLMNQYSSRSHAIFTILLERTTHYPLSSLPTSTEATPIEGYTSENTPPTFAENEAIISSPTAGKIDIGYTRSEPEVTRCKFHFVDLAGSERAKRTGAEGQRMREGIDINKGLHVLGNVISALGDVSKRGKVHVPYRDSKLTRMLQDSLGGNSKTLMVCCISPADINYSESLNALKYANRARNIQNKPVVNVDPTSLIILELRRQIQVLASELFLLKGNNVPERKFLTDGSSSLVTSGSSIITGELSKLALGNTAYSMTSRDDVASTSNTSNPPRQQSPGSKAIRSLPVTGASASTSTSTSQAGTSSADKMKIMKLEDDFNMMKQRSDNGDLEIFRLNEKIKHLQSHVSDVNERNILLQSEVDYYKLKYESPSCNDDGSDLSIGIEVDPAMEEKKMQTLPLIANYIREIESLKSALSQANKSQLNSISQYSLNLNKMDEDFSFLSDDDNNASSMNVMSTSALEGELTANVAKVISETQLELYNEQKRLLRLKTQSAAKKNGSVLASSDEMYCSDDGGDALDSSKTSNQFSLVQEEDRTYQRRQKIMAAEMTDISESIQVKEQLVMQLQKSQKQYELMKRFYEEKLLTLCREMDVKEAEKQRMTEELQKLFVLNKSASQKENDKQRGLEAEMSLKEKLSDKENELKALRQKQEELSSLSKVHSRSSQQISKLEADIIAMKRQRVELSLTLQQEKRNHYIALNQKVKEIDKLKRELLKTTAKMQQLGVEKDNAQQKVRDIIRENSAKRRLGSVNEMSKNLPTNSRDSSGESAATTLRRSLRVNTSERKPLTENQEKMKKWLDKQVRDIAAREEAVEKLKRQYELQLSLHHKKKMLEESRASIRDVIVSAKLDNNPTLSGGGSSDEVLSIEEEEALAEIEDRISTLDGQLKYRNEQISSIELSLDDPNANSGRISSTMQKLQTAAANSLPAAHELIQIIFNMLVSSKKTAWSRKEILARYEEREKKLLNELEELKHRLSSMTRQHAKDIDRLDREYDEKISGLVEYSSFGQLLHGSQQAETTAGSPSSPPESVRSTLQSAFRRPSNSYSNIFTEGSVDSNDGENVDVVSALRTMLMVANDKNTTYKERLQREENRIMIMNITIDELKAEQYELNDKLLSKDRDIKFLEDECRMLQEMVSDLKIKLMKGSPANANNTQSLISAVDAGNNNDEMKMRQRKMSAKSNISSDDNVEDGADTDENLSILFSSLGQEISQHGELRYASEQKTSSSSKKSYGSYNGSMSNADKNIFDRLTNPNNFTGTQKNIFEQDIEINRAKVAHVKEMELQQKKKKEENFFLSFTNSFISNNVTSGTSGTTGSSGTSKAVTANSAIATTGDSANNAINSEGSAHFADAAYNYDDGNATAATETSYASRSGKLADTGSVASPTSIMKNVNSFSAGSGKHVINPNDIAAASSGGGTNVFSRLLNPEKFTGIHKRRQNVRNVDNDSIDDSGRGLVTSSAHGMTPSHVSLLQSLDSSHSKASVSSKGNHGRDFNSIGLSSNSSRYRSPPTQTVQKNRSNGSITIPDSSPSSSSSSSLFPSNENDKSNVFTQFRQRIVGGGNNGVTSGGGGTDTKKGQSTRGWASTTGNYFSSNSSSVEKDKKMMNKTSPN